MPDGEERGLILPLHTPEQRRAAIEQLHEDVEALKQMQGTVHMDFRAAGIALHWAAAASQMLAMLDWQDDHGNGLEQALGNQMASFMNLQGRLHEAHGEKVVLEQRIQELEAEVENLKKGRILQ